MDVASPNTFWGAALKFAQAMPVGFLGPTTEGGCGQTWLSRITPAVAHGNAMWGLISQPGDQTILSDAAGGLSLRSPGWQAQCQLTDTAMGAAQTGPSSFPFLLILLSWALL